MQSQDTTPNTLSRAKLWWERLIAWVTRDEHKRRAIELRDSVEKAFTEHPHSAGETYTEHLWFTTKMMFRLLYSGIVVVIHGIFPFLLEREASSQLEKIYLIMKSRIPESRRNEIDANDSQMGGTI